MKTFNHLSKQTFVITGALLLLLILPSGLLAQQTPQEWLAAVDRNLNPVQYESYRKLINVEPDGSKKEFVLFTVKQGKEKAVALFLSPASEKGRSTLRIGDNMWLYIPNVGRPIRITSLQSVTGGVFNNSDILSIDYQTEYNAVSLKNADQKEGTGGLLQLDLKAKTGSVAYDRLEMIVDPKTQMPIKIRALAASGMLIKTLYFKKVTDFGDGIKRPAVVETDSPLYKDYKSIMIFAGIKSRILPPEVFTPDYMGRIESLRQK
ncbi:MAG: outer membrane lipoprotein-sorting protein [SAR324 cluster bacterium]|nr:outer membrane lipoprotein-sorting protein [SAR324 cluster bacterium]